MARSLSREQVVERPEGRRGGGLGHLLLSAYTYVEFFLVATLFVPLLFCVHHLHRRDEVPRIQGRWMRRFGRLVSRLTPLWRFSVRGSGPGDIGHSSYVVVSNHESSADPFLLSFLPWDMRWLAKAEVFRPPITGWLMRCSGDIPIRRGDRNSVQHALDECRRTLGSGLSIMMFPEGTRSPDGRLLPFKDGAFTLAIETQRPILPVVLSGTRACRPKGSLGFGRATARVRVLEPIDTAGMTLDDVRRLRETVRDVIAASR